jgi:hypothetical protein
MKKINATKEMDSQRASAMYKWHGPLPLVAAKKLLDTNPQAVLRGYCSGPGSWIGPYDYAIIDLCDLNATIHAYDPNQELREGHGENLREVI